jgi:N-acetylmuramoyl-L-alanine amidase
MASMQASNDIDIVARTLYGEARGEGYRGMQAVANVIMNRVAMADSHRHFGDGSPASACQAPWQFSCWNENDPNRQKILDLPDGDPLFEQALLIAGDAVNGILTDITDSATYYYVNGSPIPEWAEGENPCANIGKHLFFKNIA